MTFIVPIYFVLLIPYVYVRIAKTTGKHVVASIVVFLMIFIPFHRTIIAHAYFKYLLKTPLSVVSTSVEKPISILWEDNRTFEFYGGIDSDYSKQHFKNINEKLAKTYLNGEHIQLFIFKGLGEKYYVYHADEDDYKNSLEIASKLKFAREAYEHEATRENASVFSKMIFEQIRVKHIEDLKVLDKVEIYNNESDIPPVNYRIVFSNMPTTLFSNNSFLKIIYSDRVDIIDEKNNKTIAYSERYKVYKDFFGKIGDSLSTPPFSPTLGEQVPRRFILEVFMNKYARDTALLGKRISRK